MRIVAAMSGGVDSSVAAALLVEEGHEVVGVHMKLHDRGPSVAPEGGGACCGLDDALDARRVAGALGIPFYVVDLAAEFRAAVMDDFARQYRAGLTPNPCVQCNGVVKFDVLLRRARLLGAEALATGHYARTDGRTLRVAADPAKDQSYFLFPIAPEALARTRFPLGGMTKPEVRAHAERLGLVTASKPESMEVCFLPDHDHARFVGEWAAEQARGAGGAADAAGDGLIVDEAGTVLGRHDGYWRYTVGQRRGLGIAAPEPVYVLRVEPETRRVVVGPGERLLETRLEAAGGRWLRPPVVGERLAARIRHRGALLPVEVEAVEPLALRFLAPARAVTPGQAVVLYDGDEVRGGAWIRRSGAVAASAVAGDTGPR